MTKIYVDTTTLIALGSIGELDLLASLGGELVVFPAIQREITTEPAATNVERFLDRDAVTTASPVTDVHDERAMEVLGESDCNGDVRVIAAVLAHTASGESVAVVSDDRRLRTVAGGLGARITGTIGVIVRAVEEGVPADEAKALVRRVDEHGLHTTGELRETAYSLIESAAN